VTFIDKLTQVSRKNQSLLCVGLDPDPRQIPEKTNILDFNKAIIEATSDLVCTYKLNFAFYEALGNSGFDVLKKTVEHIPDHIPVIGDAKRGDIGNTAKAYAVSIFDNFNFDATTVNPYLGFDSLEPFIQYHDRGIFVLCRTSNTGAADFQSIRSKVDGDDIALFEIVAKKVSQWNTYGNLGLVVGATYPDELKLVRQLHPDMHLLIPGIGAQGGDLEATVRYGVDAQGEKAIINSSRQILYASRGDDFAQAARKATSELREHINIHRSEPAS
jgi:orotidine-5'-phosphate decarboxylase